ncbi:beta strand repeat-containing protein [Alicyclobacillus acidoterrestris]|uniref:beta strand repeat-containing protein n=1 Tax=Alicyclobacillus acidoterrestris TaxID=1450 RepID=UPI0003854EC9|nr:hypothetical protein [Alicyclobacillus acidoterrestris]EPZ45565.1 hypothetical protein N007_08970 [Alicyclobacillus acidoterrestris ATCC 49025]
MKRSLTGIAAAAVVLGAMSPMAFAATSKATGLTKASQLPIVVNGKVLSNPYEMTGKDSGNTTGFFPIYYFNQALAKIGFTATWDGTTHTWAITAPGVTPTVGTVGTGNTTVTVNGTVVRKFNTQVAKDPAGGAKAQATTYLPIYYVQSVLSALGVQGSFSGQTGLSISGGSTTVSAGLSTLAVSGATSGTGAINSPAVSLNDAAVTLSTTLTDASGNALGNTAVTFNISNYGNYPSDLPTVKDANGNVLSVTKQSNAAQYTTYTNASGVASISITTPGGTTDAYEVVATAPYGSSTGGTVSSQPAYVQFVANNEAGLSPYAGSGNPFKASIGNAVPITVTLPPTADGQAQANALVTLTVTNADGSTTHAQFVNSAGQAVGTSIQVATNSSGIAQANLIDANGETVEVTASGLPTNVNTPDPTYISFAQGGIPAKISNISVSSNTPNIGDNVVVSGQLQDASGNPVANGQILVTSPNGDSNDFAYVSGSTTTDFPLIAQGSVTVGTPATSAYGDLVTADANGNFSFTVTDPRVETEDFYIYPVANGEVQSATPLNTSSTDDYQLAFQASSNLKYLSIGANDNYVASNSDTSMTGLTATANAGGITGGGLGADPMNGSNPQITDIYVEPQNAAGHHTGGALVNQSFTYSLTADNGGEIYSINGQALSSPAGGVTLQYTPGKGFTVNGVAFPSLSGAKYASDFEVGVINSNTGTTNFTVSSGSVKSTASITFNGGSPNYVDTFTPAAASINGGGQQKVTFTVEDANGNPVPDTATDIYTDGSASDKLWLTQVNGITLTGNLNLQTSGSTSASWSTVNTPIPLGTDVVNYSVSDSGVASWSGKAGDPIEVYSDDSGNVSLTLQAGGLSYPTQYEGSTDGNPSTPVPAATTGGQVGFWSDTNGDLSTTVPLYIGVSAPTGIANASSFSEEATLTWAGGNSTGTTPTSNAVGVGTTFAAGTKGVAGTPDTAYLVYTAGSAGDTVTVGGETFTYGKQFTSVQTLVSSINSQSAAGFLDGITAKVDSANNSVIDLTGPAGSLTGANVPTTNNSADISYHAGNAGSAGTQGTATLTVTSTAITGGNLVVTVNGIDVTVPNITTTDSVSDIANAIVAAVNGDAATGVTASIDTTDASGATVLFTQNTASDTQISVSVQG